MLRLIAKMSRLSIVIFGATGFAGKHAVLQMVKFNKQYPELTWGIAGRSKTKLEALLQDVGRKTGEDLNHVRIILAEVDDDQSLKDMCSQAQVIANCCGPYRLYGEPVVRAAIATNTHHVDITGEPQFIEPIYLKYHTQAQEAGVYVISACGYDSIPNDMGVVFLQQNFDGNLNSVESYMSNSIPPEYEEKTKNQPYFFLGTWESFLYEVAHFTEREKLWKKMFPEKLPEFKPKLKKRCIVHSSRSRWHLQFPGVDESIVYRTQHHQHQTRGERPVQFHAYVTVRDWCRAIRYIMMVSVVFLMTRFKFFHKILLKYPGAFSLGMVSREGPPEVLSENLRFETMLYGEGWQHGTTVDQPFDKRMVARISGVNPVYGATVTGLLCSAITILLDSDKMPDRGGVLTTGVAFRDTFLIKRLSDNNFKFEIVQDDTSNKTNLNV